jgi:ABC-type nickel/cobalt efflux system permease component RcnA
LALGLTVTITHTLGVFALGLVTLFLSQYILPERLYPWLGASAGLLVIIIGGGLLVGRLRRLAAVSAPRPAMSLQPAVVTAMPPAAGWHRHGNGAWHHHASVTAMTAPHHHAVSDEPGQAQQSPTHRHGPFDHWLGDHHHHDGPGGHSHALPEHITWRGLLALGISGGLLPCPSALVLLLSAIALQRVTFGLLLIVAFSAGLAAVLTAIGLLLVYAGRLFARLPIEGRPLRLLPVGSALLVTLVGLAMMAQALAEAGLF